jgi:ribosomal protein S18 acetylase RimI-like enzyme
MMESRLTTAQRLYRNGGSKAVVALTLKRLIRPIATVGSMYFLERHLNVPMPQLQPMNGIDVREGTLSDVPLLNAMENAGPRKDQAVQRLKQGDRWFIGIEKPSGKLTNYRWVSLTRGFIPELNRDLVLKPGEAYVYDLETLPEFRRRGIEGITRQFTYNTLLNNYGVQRIVVYILADNRASLQAGRQYLTAITRVWFMRVRGRVFTYAPQNTRMPALAPSSAQSLHAALFARSSNSLR